MGTDRAERRRRYRKPMTLIGVAAACSAAARHVGFLPVAVPLLLAGAVLLIVGGVQFVRTANALPPDERRKERRQMVIGGVGALVAIALISGGLMLAMG
jgi:hypothetical protein